MKPDCAKGKGRRKKRGCKKRELQEERLKEKEEGEFVIVKGKG